VCPPLGVIPLDRAQEVSLLAKKRLPSGVLVSLEQGLDDALLRTAALLDDPSVHHFRSETSPFSTIPLDLRSRILIRVPKALES
jgi:hypothetical protein